LQRAVQQRTEPTQISGVTSEEAYAIDEVVPPQTAEENTFFRVVTSATAIYERLH